MREYNSSEKAKIAKKNYLNSVEGSEKHQEWIEANKDRVSIYKKSYRRTPAGKLSRDKSNKSISYKISKRKWTIKNRPLLNSLAAKRRAQELNATPKWSDLKAIEQFYKNCPKGYHVDHIMPLQGKEVCGLHILCNLQYLKAIDNIKKGNKLYV
jgi:hypothetical protein